MSKTLEQFVDEMFDFYDADKSGTLHAVDIRGGFDKLAAERPDLGLTDAGYQAWFDGIDGNGSGDISKEDLLNYLRSINYVPQ